MIGRLSHLASQQQRHSHLIAFSSGTTTTLRLDRAVVVVASDNEGDGDEGDGSVELCVQRKQDPVLVYVQGSEALWLNPLLPRGPQSEKLLRGFGLLMGLTVANM